MSAVHSKATPKAWRKALDDLPDRSEEGQTIPSFFFAHGHPGVYFGTGGKGPKGMQSKGGELYQFWQDFGPTLLKKYKPKLILVLSAHWETSNTRLVSDYGQDQPLLYDYYGFPDEFYKTKWHSNGSTNWSDRIVETFTRAGLPARKLGQLEVRGEDGQGGPSSGLDHGVFIPFKVMFPEGNEKMFSTPVVQVSIDESLDPWDEIKLGKALEPLRKQGVLILSGGLTIHTFQNMSEWSYDSSSEETKQFENEIVRASEIQDSQQRLQGLAELTKLPGFRKCHPREEHFAPIWIAAGAGSQGESRVLLDLHGHKSVAFGVE